MEKDKAANPLEINLLCAQGVMLDTQMRADAIEEFGAEGGAGRFGVSICLYRYFKKLARQQAKKGERCASAARAIGAYR